MTNLGVITLLFERLNSQFRTKLPPFMETGRNGMRLFVMVWGVVETGFRVETGGYG